MLVRILTLKAPAVTVTTARLGAFLGGKAYKAFTDATQLGRARYDGSYLELRSRGTTLFATFAVDRAKRQTGCAVFPRVKNSDKVCPLD